MSDPNTSASKKDVFDVGAKLCAVVVALWTIAVLPGYQFVQGVHDLKTSNIEVKASLDTRTQIEDLWHTTISNQLSDHGTRISIVEDKIGKTSHKIDHLTAMYNNDRSKKR